MESNGRFQFLYFKYLVEDYPEYLTEMLPAAIEQDVAAAMEFYHLINRDADLREKFLKAVVDQNEYYSFFRFGVHEYPEAAGDKIAYEFANNHPIEFVEFKIGGGTLLYKEYGYFDVAVNRMIDDDILEAKTTLNLSFFEEIKADEKLYKKLAEYFAKNGDTRFITRLDAAKDFPDLEKNLAKGLSDLPDTRNAKNFFHLFFPQYKEFALAPAETLINSETYNASDSQSNNVNLLNFFPDLKLPHAKSLLNKEYDSAVYEFLSREYDKEFPDLFLELTQKLVDKKRYYVFFRYGFDDKVSPEYAKRVAQMFAEYTNSPWELDTEWYKKYKEEFRPAAIEFVKEAPDRFFLREMYKIYPDIGEENISRVGTRDFFVSKDLPRDFPDESLRKAKDLIKQDKLVGTFNFFIYGVHKVYTEMGRDLARKLAASNSRNFLINYKLHEYYPEEGRSIAKFVANSSQYRDFLDANLHKTYPEFGRKIADNLIDDDEFFEFFKNYHFHTEYPDLGLKAVRKMLSKPTYAGLYGGTSSSSRSFFKWRLDKYYPKEGKKIIKERVNEQIKYDEKNPDTEERPLRAKQLADEMFEKGYITYFHTGRFNELDGIGNITGEICVSSWDLSRKLFTYNTPTALTALFRGKPSHMFNRDSWSESNDLGLRMLTSHKSQTDIYEMDAEHDEAWFNPSHPGNSLVGYAVLSDPSHEDYDEEEHKKFISQAKKLAETNDAIFIDMEGNPWEMKKVREKPGIEENEEVDPFVEKYKDRVPEFLKDYASKRISNRDIVATGESINKLINSEHYISARVAQMTGIIGIIKKMISKRAKVKSDKPAYKEKKKTDKGYVWIYDDKHVEKRWKEKKEKLKKLEKELKKVRSQYQSDLTSDDERTRAIAAIVGIMDDTAMRIGNEESAKEGTFGATTLKVKHVKGGSGNMTFDFPGKGLIEQNVTLKNNKVIKVIRDLMKGKKANDFIFEVDGKKIWDRAVNRYLKPLGISAKDLRGFHANRLMKEHLKKKDFKDALEDVADIVGHEASTLKNQYLDPELVEKHDKNTDEAKKVEKKDKKKAAFISIRAVKPGPDAMTKQGPTLPQKIKDISQPRPEFGPAARTIDDPSKATTEPMKPPAAPMVDVGKNVANVRGDISNYPNLQAAWKILAPFLPDGAYLSSGWRSDNDQAKIILEYWLSAQWSRGSGKTKWEYNKGFFNTQNPGQNVDALRWWLKEVKSPKPVSGDMHRKLNRDIEPLRAIMTSYDPSGLEGEPPSALQIAPLGKSKHLLGQAFDVSGASLLQIKKAAQYVNKYFGNIFSNIRYEKAQAVHIVVSDNIQVPNAQALSIAIGYYNKSMVATSSSRLLSKRAEITPEDQEWISGLKGGAPANLSTDVRKDLRIKPNAKVNDLMLAAWRTLLPFLPQRARLTSGSRTPDDQIRILDDYWAKATGRRVPDHLRGDMRTWRQVSKLLKQNYGYIVGPPSTNKQFGHLKHNAIDISGGDLNDIASAVRYVSREKRLPVRFRNPQIEYKNNAVHVGIESATWDEAALSQVLSELGGRYATAPDTYISKTAEGEACDMLIKSIYGDLVSSGAPKNVIDEYKKVASIPKISLLDDVGMGIDDEMGDWFEKSPMFRHREEEPDHDIHDVGDSEASKMAEEDPEKFFYTGLHKEHPDLEAKALRSMIENNAKFYFVFKYHEKDGEEYKNLLEPAAEALSQQDARAFFYYHLHREFPELGRGAIVQLIDTNPDSFFDLGLQQDYPDLEESAGAARNIKDPHKVELEQPEWLGKDAEPPRIAISSRNLLDTETTGPMTGPIINDTSPPRPSYSRPDIPEGHHWSLAPEEARKTPSTDKEAMELDPSTFLGDKEIKRLFPHLVNTQVERLSLQDPVEYFLLKYYKDPEHKALNHSAVKKLIDMRPRKYFDFALFMEDEFVPFAEAAARSWSEADSESFVRGYEEVFKNHEVSRDAMDKAMPPAQKLSSYKKAGESSKEERVAKLVDEDPLSFFEMGVDNDFPDLRDKALNEIKKMMYSGRHPPGPSILRMLKDSDSDALRGLYDEYKNLQEMTGKYRGTVPPISISRPRGICNRCKSSIPLGVQSDEHGYYVGRNCDCGPYSVESFHFDSEEEARKKLESYQNSTEKTSAMISISKREDEKRPPKKWWYKMVKEIKKNSPDYSKERADKTVGDIWFNNLTEKKRKQISKRDRKPDKSKKKTSMISRRAEPVEIQLTEKEEQIFDLIKGAIQFYKLNTTARVAGGWVRDKIMGRVSKDIDIAVDNMMGKKFASYIDMYARQKGIEAKTGLISAKPEQGKNLETAIVRLLDEEIEIVNLRDEEYEEGSRWPKTIITNSPTRDAFRRDFTINSLFYNINTGEVEDFTGTGIDDIKNNILRTPTVSKDNEEEVGRHITAKQTFMDDPLRILRAVRFANRYSLNVAPEVAEAAKDPEVQAAFRSMISRERIEIELRKIMSETKSPKYALELIRDWDLRGEVLQLPEEYDEWEMDQNNPHHELNLWGHLMEALDNIQVIIKEKDLSKADRYILNWATLLHDVGKLDPNIKGTKDLAGQMVNTYYGHEESSIKAAEYLLRNLPGTTVDEIERIKSLIDAARRMNSQHVPPDQISRMKRKSMGKILRLLSKFKGDWERAMEVAMADASSHKKDWIQKYPRIYWESLSEQFRGMPEGTATMGPLLNGQELMQLFGRKGGQWLGSLNRAMIEWQMEHPQSTKDQAVEFAKRYYDEQELNKVGSLMGKDSGLEDGDLVTVIGLPDIKFEIAGAKVVGSSEGEIKVILKQFYPMPEEDEGIAEAPVALLKKVVDEKHEPDAEESVKRLSSR